MSAQPGQEVDSPLRSFLFAASRGGGRNFRPLEGHETLDGSVLASGLVYRSGFLGQLSPGDRSRLEDARTVITLQTPKELEILGSPIGDDMSAVSWEHIPIGDRWFRDDDADEADFDSMGAFYVRMVTDHPEHWARFFGLLTDRGRYPVVFHCTAGRDRTGVAAALLLEALGVPRPRILEEQLASNEAFPDNPQEPDILEPLFASIDAAGGIEPFLSRLDISPDALETVRRILLVEARG